jgi:hypothetical protein
MDLGDDFAMELGAGSIEEWLSEPDRDPLASDERTRLSEAYRSGFMAGTEAGQRSSLGLSGEERAEQIRCFEDEASRRADWYVSPARTDPKPETP